MMSSLPGLDSTQRECMFYLYAVKLLNTNQSYWRPAILFSFPISKCSLFWILNYNIINSFSNLNLPSLTTEQRHFCILFIVLSKVLLPICSPNKPDCTN